MTTASKIGGVWKASPRLGSLAEPLFAVLDLLTAHVADLLEATELIRRAQDLEHAIAALALALDLHHLHDGLELCAQRRFFALLGEGQVGVLLPLGLGLERRLDERDELEAHGGMPMSMHAIGGSEGVTDV